jgi:hypothetical protein
VLLLLASGCSSSVSLAEVTGIVRFQGRPLTSGEVTFFDADGTKSFSGISETGAYNVQGVKFGKARISVVSTPRVPPGLTKPGSRGATPPSKQEEPIDIPKRYSDPESSKLRVEIDSRKQQFNIDLEP